MDSRKLIELETELVLLQKQSYASPYMGFARVKRSLAEHGFHLDSEDHFVDMNYDEGPVFFQLFSEGDPGWLEEYPTKPIQDDETEEEPVFLTFEYESCQSGYTIEINIMTEEELEEFIGDDEVSDI